MSHAQKIPNFLNFCFLIRRPPQYISFQPASLTNATNKKHTRHWRVYVLYSRNIEVRERRLWWYLRTKVKRRVSSDSKHLTEVRVRSVHSLKGKEEEIEKKKGLMRRIHDARSNDIRWFTNHYVPVRMFLFLKVRINDLRIILIW